MSASISSPRVFYVSMCYLNHQPPSYLLVSLRGTASWGSEGQQGWSCWSTAGPGWVLGANPSCYSESGQKTHRLEVRMATCVCTACVLSSSLRVPDGSSNHCTRLHHRRKSAMSAEQSQCGRQNKTSKEEKEERRNRNEAGKRREHEKIWKRRQLLSVP